MNGSFQPTWESLRRYQTPEWFREAKFGIYTHWGIYSVPACRPNGSWYGFYMYQKGSPQYEHHVKTYGGPEKFGYKDFIPQFTGEKFDADEWAELFRAAGAKYAGPVGEHHDGFSMWDTKLTRWNSAAMGPKRDVVAELEQAIRRNDMKFMVALHHAENWRFFPHWVSGTDLSDPRYFDFYGKPHDLDWADGVPDRGVWPVWNAQSKPDQAFLDLWLAKTKEVVDRFNPDMLWFDFGIGFVQEHYKREMMAYYYNHILERGQEPVLTYKYSDLVPGSGMIDLELGRFDKMTYHEWLTDTTVDDGEGWCYLSDARYKQPGEVVRYLVDNVSKNGYLLLNVGPKPNGEIPEEAKEILREMGRWLKINGEAIYGTSPWMISGEGPAKMEKSGMFSEGEKLCYTGEDIRFTCKGEDLYAILMAWPGQEAVIHSAEQLFPGEIAAVTMLGHNRPLDWKLNENGLTVSMPKQKPCDHAYALKIHRKRPY